MMSLSILWTLLLVATVSARSEVSITEAGLDAENAGEAENALKTDINDQNNADIEDAILSRMGLDTLSPSSKQSDSDGVNLDKALDEQLHETLSRLGGFEPDEVSNTNYENIAISRSGIANDEVYLSVDGLSRNGLNRNRYSLYPASSLQNRNTKPYYDVRNSGYNNWNINDQGGISSTLPNSDNDLLMRIATLNGLQESKLNNLNNLRAAQNNGRNAIHYNRNHLFDVSRNGPGRLLLGRQGLSNDDLENARTNQEVAAIDEIIANKNLIDSEKFNRNNNNLSVRKNIALNPESNLLNQRNSDIDAELSRIIANVRSSNNGINELNKFRNLADDSNVVNELDQLSRHGIRTNRYGTRKLSLNDLSQMRSAISNLGSSAINTKTGSIEVDQELAGLLPHVRTNNNDLNDLNKISSLNDDSNVLDNLSRHGLRNNRIGVNKLSLNDLNDAKRLIGPLSLDKSSIANRASKEIDGALLNALNTKNDFNALGALAVLNKATAKASQNLLLNNILGRSDTDVESNLLSKLGSTEDSEVNGISSQNPFDEALNSLAVLSRIDSTNDAESSVNSEYSPENLSRSHKSLLRNLVDNNSENQITEDEVDEDSSLLSRIGNRWNRNRFRHYGLRLPNRPYRIHKRYRPTRPYYIPSLYRSGLDSELNDDHSDLEHLSKLAKLSSISSLRNEENENSLEEILNTVGKNELSDISADLSEAQVRNLIDLHDHSIDQVLAKNHLKRVSALDDEKSARHKVSKLDKELRDAKNLLLTGSLSNSKEQRRKVSGKSNLRLLSGEENDKHDDVVLVPVKIGSGAALNRAGGLYDISNLIDLGVVN